MTADYERVVGEGEVLVLTVGRAVSGLMVLKTGADHLLVSNVAVAGPYQGRGFRRALFDQAERRAARQGLVELRLFTNEAMRENLTIYPKLGWEEHDRAK